MSEQTKQESTRLGYVTIYSGSLVLADGIIANNMAIPEDQRLLIDLERPAGAVRYPILATTQGSDRFLVIPLDRAEPIPDVSGDTVQVSDPVEMDPEEAESTNDPELQIG